MHPSSPNIFCACTLVIIATICVSHVHCESLGLEFGVEDTFTYVGRLFHYSIPKNAFHGTNIRYEVEGHLSKELPPWLIFDETTKTLEGIPTPDDVGETYILLKAIDEEGTVVTDRFSIQVFGGALLERNFNEKRKCKSVENIAMLSLVVDKAMPDIDPKQRVNSIKNLAGFLGMDTNQLTMLPQPYQDPKSDSIVDSGLGDAKRKLSHTSTVIMWQVGCEGEIWAEKIKEVKQMKQIARDGTLSEVLQMPVMGWHIINNMNPFRERRDILSDASKNSVDGEIDDGKIPITTIEPEGDDQRSKHRHHHGEEDNNSSLLYDKEKVPGSPPSSIGLYTVEPTSPVTINQLVTAKRNNLSDIGTTLPSSAENEITSYSQSSPTFEPETLSTQDMNAAFVDRGTSSLDDFLPSLSTGSVYTSTGVSKPSTVSTKAPTVPTAKEGTRAPSSTAGEVVSNKPPVLNHLLKKWSITAGKPASYQIEPDTFVDEEQTDTRNLKLSFSPSSPTSWIQFNSSSQVVYALPLEEHVSRWMYDIIATDKQGASVSDTLEVLVQHHKKYRSVTHEISMYIQVESPGTLKFTSMVDWQLFLYDKLLEIYGNDRNNSYITVRSVVTNKEPYLFTWTNESLPRNDCPSDQVIKLLEVISNTTSFQPKPILNNALGKYLTVKNVTWKGVGHCQDAPPIQNKPKYTTNLTPVIRNPIDHLEAIAGELLVYHVPEDTFFDREDGGTRTLRLILMTMDRTTISQTNWLQFDAKNQEFYGIPTMLDKGRREYQLVCEDSGGRTANDGLEVIVKPPTNSYYSAEFSILVRKSFVAFTNPMIQRLFIEKLAKLFGDKDATNVVNIEFEENKNDPKSTYIRWANRTLLSNDGCPEETIGILRQVLLTDEYVQETVYQHFDKDYEIMAATVKPTGICEGLKTPLHVPGVDRKPAGNGKISLGNPSVEYLITFLVPLVVIITMLLCAACIACLLYRRRHTGKMSVRNGLEGAIVRTKGIPVIFQDELEEKLESSNKSPIILKQEKPPLPPPEYNRGHPTVTTALLSDIDDNSPYQPPPSFNGSSPRPKPTPTYRMPPPYSP